MSSQRTDQQFLRLTSLLMSRKSTVEYNTATEVKVTNEEKTGSITVHKTTEGQKNIEGIKFYLRGTSDSGRAIDIPANN